MMKLRVTGMTCSHCAHAVSEALAGVAGVERVVEVNVQQGEAVLEGSPKIPALLQAVREAGFQAEATE